MVRLGGRAKKEFKSLLTLFQFQHGAIGRPYYGTDWSIWRGFQFQHGAIGSVIDEAHHATAGTVSIPAWCDWETNAGFTASASVWVSIPAWCDWETARSFSLPTLIPVSIPAWCDWEMYDNTVFVHPRPRFNSSMVRLGVRIGRNVISLQHVSIPAWCDWEG